MAVMLGNQSVGSIVKLKYEGSLREFIVVHQGKPSSIYDDSCDGTWLMIKAVSSPYDYSNFSDSNNFSYNNSKVGQKLNDWISNFDISVQAKIKQVKIPYCYNSSNLAVNSGQNGFSCKLFAPSTLELGMDPWGGSYIPRDGAKLDYFLDGNSPDAEGRRFIYLTNNPSAPVNLTYWTRTLNNVGGDPSIIVCNGWTLSSKLSSQNLIRFMLIMPKSVFVYDDGTVADNTAPTAPSNISVPQTIYGGSSITVSWGPSADAQGNLQGYILEFSNNGGSSWSQVYQGTQLSYSTMIPFGTPSVMYRVKAYDSEGLQSSYTTSGQVVVINNTAPTAPVSINVPEVVLGGDKITISWSASSDAQGNLAGYELERQIANSGWAQVYKGNQTSFQDTISQDWANVQYRVRAYDTLNATSQYTVSPVRNVEQLIVTAVNVPDVAMQGQPIPVSWSKVSSADTYVLERKASTDEGFVQVYTGPLTSYTDTAESWTSVQYRVKAGRSTVFGNYATSKSFPVVTTAALVISGQNGDLGTIVDDVRYTVSSNTGNEITVTRKVNGNMMAKVKVESGFSYAIPIIDLPTGAGTIVLDATVNVTDGGPVSITRTWTYVKEDIQIPKFGSVSILYKDNFPTFPVTLPEAVRAPDSLGGSLDKVYQLLIPILGMAVTDVGSYVGTGTFGSSSPNTITLDFTPSLVIISGESGVLTISRTTSSGGESDAYIQGNTVKWYSTSAESQLNEQGKEYSYVAIGKAGA